MTGARFAKEESIQWSTEQQEFRFSLETETTTNGEAQLLITGLPAQNYKVIGGTETSEFHPDGKRLLRICVPAGSSKAKVEIVGS